MCIIIWLVVQVTNFDERQCHKWALLLRQRHEKLTKLLASVGKRAKVKSWLKPGKEVWREGSD